MRTLMALLFFLVLSVPESWADIIVPDPDRIGVYFDESAFSNDTWASASVPFDAFVILTNPSSSAILGYEFAYRVSVTPEMEPLVFRLDPLFPGIFPINPALPPYDIFKDEVITGPFDPVPLPGDAPVVLLAWRFMLLAPGIWMDFFLGPTSGEGMTNGRLAYESESGPVHMSVANGNPQNPVATVNRVSPVTGETFGSVKALYR